MILRPLEPAPSSSEFVPAWPAVERIQRQTHKSCWLITQPSHAALAAELAASIAAPQFPVADEQILQAIALHDAGWGIPDAQAIMRSRSGKQQQPESFIATAVPQFLAAWEKSIETCQAVSPAGGYIVSRHFWRLAGHRVKFAHDESTQDRQKLESFLKAEEKRQKRLAGRQSLTMDKLELLTDLLQFCDLFSLYICSGATENVVFPEYFGLQLRVKTEIFNTEQRREQRKIRTEDQDLIDDEAVETYELDPPVVKRGAEFVFAALRHPATKQESSREIRVRIG